MKDKDAAVCGLVRSLPVAVGVFAQHSIDARNEVLGVDHPPAAGRNGRPLLQQFMKDGEIVPGWTGPDAVGRARDRHTASMAELPRVVDRLQPGEPAIPTIYE